MKTLEEIEDDEINARNDKTLTSGGVIFPDDLRNRLLYHILVQMERIANSLFMQNKMEHDRNMDDTPYKKDEWPHEWTDEEIKHSRENPDPLDVAEEG